MWALPPRSPAFKQLQSQLFLAPLFPSAEFNTKGKAGRKRATLSLLIESPPFLLLNLAGGKKGLEGESEEEKAV